MITCYVQIDLNRLLWLTHITLIAKNVCSMAKWQVQASQGTNLFLKTKRKRENCIAVGRETHFYMMERVYTSKKRMMT